MGRVGRLVTASRGDRRDNCLRGAAGHPHVCVAFPVSSVPQGRSAKASGLASETRTPQASWCPPAPAVGTGRGLGPGGLGPLCLCSASRLCTLGPKVPQTWFSQPPHGRRQAPSQRGLGGTWGGLGIRRGALGPRAGGPEPPRHPRTGTPGGCQNRSPLLWCGGGCVR